MMQGRDLSQEATEADFEPLSPEEQPPTTRKKKSKIKKRFSDEQVRSLETIFEMETKLDPRKKLQVARELGLQPRQVAIWFQNKRARWKSKQVEKNYRILESNYDNLKVQFDAMKKEKESLLEQELQRLAEKSQEGSSGCKDFAAHSQDSSREKRESLAGIAASARSSSLQEELGHQGVFYSDDDKSGNMAHLSDEEAKLLRMTENLDGSIISPVKWCSFDAESLFNQSSTSSHWWDSWT